MFLTVVSYIFFDSLILFFLTLNQFPVNLLCIKSLILWHKGLFGRTDHFSGCTAEQFGFGAPVNITSGVYAFNRNGYGNIIQHFGKEIMQVFGFYTGDRFFVEHMNIGQYLVGS